MGFLEDGGVVEVDFNRTNLPENLCFVKVLPCNPRLAIGFAGEVKWLNIAPIMNPIQGYTLITPDDLFWRPSNLMKIPNADFLERTGSENMGARLWRMPPWSANTLHKHIRAEEFYFVLEGTGRLRVGEETLTVPKHGGVMVGPDQLRQVFNDTDEEVLWLIIGAPEELEFLQGSKSQMDLSLIYPTDPTQLPPELNGVPWPPKD
jgi:mannose-6-phosphate isomerase-like protein (cupin superfamily)